MGSGVFQGKAYADRKQVLPPMNEPAANFQQSSGAQKLQVGVNRLYNLGENNFWFSTLHL